MAPILVSVFRAWTRRALSATVESREATLRFRRNRCDEWALHRRANNEFPRSGQALCRRHDRAWARHLWSAEERAAAERAGSDDIETADGATGAAGWDSARRSTGPCLERDEWREPAPRSEFAPRALHSQRIDSRQ